MRTSTKLHRIVCLFVCVLLTNGMLRAHNGQEKTEGDSLCISLLTCAPGLEAYERFGHTALRVVDYKNDVDWVFNYGTFSFNEPNFIWRFILGEGSYYLDALPYPIFEEFYLYEGRTIVNQELNLTTDERRRIFCALKENLQPWNVKYRYNFLYDNCTTRAIQQIDNAVGSIEYFLPEADKGKTFRTIIPEATENTPWSQFGIDLLLGEEVDRPMSVQDYLFSPVYAMKLLETALARNNEGEEKKLVQNTTIVEATPTESMLSDKAPAFTPLRASIIFFCIVLVLSIYAWEKKRTFWAVDIFLLTMQAAEGCIIALLFFFSSHPAVSSNWLIMWLNPLPIMGLMMRYIGKKKALRPYYHPFAATILGISLLTMPFLPQEFPLAVYPLAGAFFIHALTSAIIETKKHINSHAQIRKN